MQHKSTALIPYTTPYFTPDSYQAHVQSRQKDAKNFYLKDHYHHNTLLERKAEIIKGIPPSLHDLTRHMWCTHVVGQAFPPEGVLGRKVEEHALRWRNRSTDSTNDSEQNPTSILTLFNPWITYDSTISFNFFAPCRVVDDIDLWKNAEALIIVPLISLLKSAVCISIAETITLGDFKLDPNCIFIIAEQDIVLPEYYEKNNFTIIRYSKEKTNKTEAARHFIENNLGGWFCDKNLNPSPSMTFNLNQYINGINCNQPSFFTNLFKQKPLLSFGQHLMSRGFFALEHTLYMALCSNTLIPSYYIHPSSTENDSDFRFRLYLIKEFLQPLENYYSRMSDHKTVTKWKEHTRLLLLGVFFTFKDKEYSFTLPTSDIEKIDDNWNMTTITKMIPSYSSLTVEELIAKLTDSNGPILSIQKTPNPNKLIETFKTVFYDAMPLQWAADILLMFLNKNQYYATQDMSLNEIYRMPMALLSMFTCSSKDTYDKQLHIGTSSSTLIHFLPESLSELSKHNIPCIQEALIGLKDWRNSSDFDSSLPYIKDEALKQRFLALCNEATSIKID